jgi:maleylacetate reductase
VSAPAILPEAVVYDPELTLGLPYKVTVSSALNAMAHAAEGLYARDRNPIASLMAAEGLRATIRALPRLRETPRDLAARADALYGAWLCGSVLGTVGMALHHKLCHVLGGSFGLPHAETHAVVLPHAVAYNQSVAADELRPLADALGGAAPGAALHGFARDVGAPTSLASLGLREADLDRAAELATRNAYWNPREVTREGVRTLLGAAWRGDLPAG